jgi:Rod binding domain-containing protein
VGSVSSVGTPGILSPIASPGDIPGGNDSARIGDAAQQFEALLLGQILHSAHDSESGWLGSGGDSSSDCASDYAEQQLAATIAQQGGLGLAKLIAAGLERRVSR